MKYYWTKGRKRQHKFYIILLVSIMVSSGIIGGLSVYTNKYILKVGETTQAYKYVPIEPKQILSIEQQIRDIAEREGFRWADYLVKLANCESRLNPLAENRQGNYPSNSTDRGLFQINNYWHYEVSDEQAFDALNCINSKPCMDCEHFIHGKLQKNSERLFELVQDSVDPDTMDLINELIENELLLERECNQ